MFLISHEGNENKAMMRYICTLIRMAKINKSDPVVQQSSRPLLLGVQNDTVTVEMVWQFKHALNLLSSSSISGYLP